MGHTCDDLGAEGALLPELVLPALPAHRPPLDAVRRPLGQG